MVTRYKTGPVNFPCVCFLVLAGGIRDSLSKFHQLTPEKELGTTTEIFPETLVHRTGGTRPKEQYYSVIPNSR
jgi:hypothetical protein